MDTDYQKQGKDFLTKHNITFKAVFKGDKCSLWDDDNHIHRGKRRFSFSFWNSFHDKQEGNTPTPYDVLTCIEKYDYGTFENFCSEFGYNTDSRKAEQTYQAVIKQYSKVIAFFTIKEIEELQGIN